MLGALTQQRGAAGALLRGRPGRGAFVSRTPALCRVAVRGAIGEAPLLIERPGFHAAAAAAQPLRRRHNGRGRLLVAAAMFDTLSSSLQKALKSVSPDGRLTAENIKEPLRDVRRALLEADVSLPVVRRFVKRVEERAVGLEVLDGVTPQVQFVKLVSDELVQLMGDAGSKDLEPARPGGGPQVVLMAGLQGVGKTTAAGKLARLLAKRGKSVLLVAADVYRPAAIDQLVKLGAAVDVPVFSLGADADPVDIARRGVEEGKARQVDAVIVDTAGRTQVDADMMAELRRIKQAVDPSDTLLVVDAMTGQEAAGLVKAFNDEVDLTGAILTKLDGDSRGGAALSVRDVSGRPIKFVGTGEKLDALEPFYPERMAQRILGMGDMLTLYEKAQDLIKQDEVDAFQARLAANKFDFNDFVDQFKRMNNMGGMQMLKLMPGFSGVSEKQLYEAEKKLKGYEAMINSMTSEEREAPELLVKSASRRRRVAEGSGRGEEAVSELLRSYAAMKGQMKNMSALMRLSGQGGGGGGGDDEALLRDMVRSAQAPVPAGKVRRKKADGGGKAARQTPLDKSRGFARSK